MSQSDIQKRSVVVNGKRTSITLESAFWASLMDIAPEESLTINGLVSRIQKVSKPKNLSSAIRLWILAYYQAQTLKVKRQLSRQRQSATIYGGSAEADVVLEFV